MESLLNDSLLVFGGLAILLAPMALALANTGPGGAGWKLLTFLCCTFAAWFFFFASSLLIALVAWVLAWACAMAMRISFNRRRA
jgi:thiosulfate reductase cytochrome b subunit